MKTAVGIPVKRTIETMSLGILLVIVVLRPLVAESYDSAGNPMTMALGSVSDPSPVRTLIFDMAILVSAVGWLVARAIGPYQRYRRTGLEWGMLIIVPAAVVSCCFAGQKRLAINATIDWLSYLVLTIVLVQLLRHRWQRRVLIAAIVATACVQAVQCFDQYFVGFEDTWAQYEEIKDEFWVRQGVDPDSAKVELFENRINAREASGFLPHSNLTGSYLMLCGLVALGVSVSGFRRSTDLKNVVSTIGCGVLATGILAAVVTTKSNGAIIAGGFGLVVWLLILMARGWVDSHRKRALLIGWILAAIGLASTVGYGLINDRLPHMSLTFRWQYWKTSSQLIADHPLTGVGRENFGRHYLQYKTIESPEEVSNPHNLFVQAAADWGVPGLAGLIVAMIGVSLTLVRRLSDRADGGDHGRPLGGLEPEILWGVFLLIALALCRLPLLDAAESEFFAYAYYTTVVTAVAWVVGYMFVVAGLRRFSSTGQNQGPILGLVGGIAVLAFIIQDLINFGLYTPACATTFFAVLAVSISERVPVEKTKAGRRSPKFWIWPAAGCVLTATVFVAYVVPVIRAETSLGHARAAQDRMTSDPVRSQPTFAHYQHAASVDRLDPTPLVRRAEWLFRVSARPANRDEALNLAVEAARAAQTRDPYSVRPPRLLTRLYQARAEFTGASEDYLAAVDAAAKALQRYRYDPRGMVVLGDCLAQAGEALDDADLRRRAVATYNSAVELDAARPEWERIRGFRSREKESIRRKIGELGASTSAP